MDDGDRRVFDGLIYLHGTTFDDEVGLVMSLSHELQHAVQHTKNRTLWLVNTLVNSLNKSLFKRLNIKWADIPIEAHARIVSKRTAEQIFVSEKVAAYIDRRIAAPVNEDDRADWISSDIACVTTLLVALLAISWLSRSRVLIPFR